MIRRCAAALVATLTAVMLVGCGGTDPAPGGAPSAAGLTYGYGPVRNASITYQPDVVFVEGGPDVIRSASADGLVWTIDGRAPGASEVRVGKIMYATSRAVGRVLEVHPAGGDIAVTLGPVTLTDVFRDAHFASERKIDPSLAVYQEIPDRPGALTVPKAASTGFAPIRAGSPGAVSDQPASDVVVAPIRLGARVDGTIPPARNASVAVTVGGWQVQPYYTKSKLGLKLGYKADEHLKVNIDFSLLVSTLSIRSNVTVANGKISDGSTFALDGVEGIAVDVAAGAANGSSDNKKVRIEVPVEIVFPVPGEPLVYVTTWKFIVGTAISGNNSTVTAGGEWSLKGALGLVAGTLVAPTLGVTKSIMDSIAGLSIGVSGLVLAVESRIQFGVGIPAAFTGPYAKLVVDLGLTNGSALGAPFARCIGATLDAKVGGGYGVSISAPASDILSKILGPKSKIVLETEKLLPFYHKAQVLPNVPLCIG
jgi:hypothetical protein